MRSEGTLPSRLGLVGPSSGVELLRARYYRWLNRAGRPWSVREDSRGVSVGVAGSTAHYTTPPPKHRSPLVCGSLIYFKYINNDEEKSVHP